MLENKVGKEQFMYKKMLISSCCSKLSCKIQHNFVFCENLSSSGYRTYLIIIVAKVILMGLFESSLTVREKTFVLRYNRIKHYFII